MSSGPYEVTKKIYLSSRKRQIELSAFIFGYRFRCRSLAGESDHGLTINSDLSIACNCSDYKGEGQLGSLKTHSLRDILEGKKASVFRESLDRGILPIVRCIGCADLERRKKGGSDHSIASPKRILVENTSGCNLRCTQCNRKDVGRNRKQQQMSLEDMQIVAKVVKENGIKRINFYNLGEPFLSPKIFEEVALLKKENPELELFCSTNGLLLKGEDKIRAALLFDHIYFTLPGGDQRSVEKYQKGQDLKQTTQNMVELIKARGESDKPVLEWKYLLFNWNDKEKYVEKAIERSKEMGIDVLSFWPTAFPPWGLPYKFYLGLSSTNKVGQKWYSGRIILYKRIDLEDYLLTL